MVESHNRDLQEELDDVKMNYERLIHEYRQLSLIH